MQRLVNKISFRPSIACFVYLICDLQKHFIYLIRTKIKDLSTDQRVFSRAARVERLSKCNSK